MENFKKALLFSTEKRAITNLVIRRIIGSLTDNQSYSLSKVFSASEIVEMTQTTAEKVWGFMS